MFAALRFPLDKNLDGRTYWYASDFPLQVGDEVLAPVGVHDRLQLGKVERVSKDPPMDVDLLKHTEAKAGERVVRGERTKCLELGGVRYDGKHFTFFRRALVTEDTEFDRDLLASYGVREFLPVGKDSIARVACSPRCVLVYGTGATALGAKIISLLRGEEKGDKELVTALREKFC